MGLVTNGYRLGFSPFRHVGGALSSYLNGAAAIRNQGLTGRMRTMSQLVGQQVAIPNGNLHPHAWMLPQKAGGMSMRTGGAGAMSASLVPTRPMSIDLTGSGDLDATAGLIVSAIVAMAGSGSLSANITGLLNASVDFTGSGDLDASMHGIAHAICNLLGSGDLDATISAYGNMTIDIVVTGTGLTTANVGQAVWSALASANNEAGSMGEKLNDAGSASNPWTEVIESGLTAAEVMRIITAAVAGKRVGLGTSTEQYMGRDGVTPRITFTPADSNGNGDTTVDGS